MDCTDRVDIWVKVLSVSSDLEFFVDDRRVSSSDRLEITGRVIGASGISDSYGQAVVSASALFNVYNGREDYEADSLGRFLVESDASEIQEISADAYDGSTTSGVKAWIDLNRTEFLSFRDMLLSGSDRSPYLHLTCRSDTPAEEGEAWPLTLSVLSLRLHYELL